MAAFNEGGFDDVKADVQITAPSEKVKDAAASSAPVPQFDTSTSAYLFDLAIECNTDAGFKHAVLERHEHFHIKGIHPHPTYSLRFGTVNDSQIEGEEPARLWAQRHIIAMEPYYVISASPLDMDANKKNRSEFFLGKLKESHGGRCFTGYSCAKDNAVQNPTVCVIYDHERAAGEKKMEVGVPLAGSCNSNGSAGGSSSDPISATLEGDFHKVRREGGQNHCSITHPVFCFHQKDDAPAVMSDDAILQKFVINDSVGATRTSTKNFQLTESHASRAAMLKPPISNPHIQAEDEGGGAGQNDENVVKVDKLEGNVVLQMGKLGDNVFSCAYKRPFNLLQVFMICLSRFETKQAY